MDRSGLPASQCASNDMQGEQYRGFGSSMCFSFRRLHQHTQGLGKDDASMR